MGTAIGLICFLLLECDNINFSSGYKAPEVAEWNKYKDDLKRKRKRKLQGTYTDLTATAPAFVEGLDEVGATVDAGVDRSKLGIDIERSKLSVDVDSDIQLRSRHCLSASNSNSSFSSTSTTPFCRDGQRPPPPRLAPPANAVRRRMSAAGSADIEEVGDLPHSSLIRFCPCVDFLPLFVEQA